MTKDNGALVAQFGTLCGATVDLIKLDEPRVDRFDHAWECNGCGQTGDTHDHLRDARTKANAHAGGCRSLPRP